MKPIEEIAKSNKEIRKMLDLAADGFCPFCAKKVTLEQFRNVRSLRECEISGLCQKCQDDTFGVD